MKSFDDIGPDVAALFRMFEIFLNNPPDLKDDAKWNLEEPVGGWMNEALIAASVFARIRSIELPLRFRYAFTAQLFSVFEARALDLCDAITKKDPSLLKIDHLRGGRSASGIRIFYEQVFPLVGLDWRPLEYLTNCRNMIVHADGRNTGTVSEARIRKMQEACPFIRVSSSGRLFLAHEACVFFLVWCGEFFDTAFAKCGYALNSCRINLVDEQEFQAFERGRGADGPEGTPAPV